MENKGITLVALVISIIVMLILAGVTISMIIGNNGIFTKVVESEKEYSKAEIGEALDMIVNSKFMEAYASSSTNGADISEYFNETKMLAYLSGTEEEGDGTAYITAVESSDKIILDASGAETEIYSVYLINVSAVSESVTRYGQGTSLDDGDVFTLEVQTDETSGASTGKYDVYYYDSDKNKSEALTTLNLYITSTDSE